MKVLVTGAAGFIGFHTSLYLLNRGNEVVGIDSLNDYYEPSLKLSRLKELDKNKYSKNFEFIQFNLSDSARLKKF